MTRDLAAFRQALTDLDAAMTALVGDNIAGSVVGARVNSWCEPELHLLPKRFTEVRHLLAGVAAGRAPGGVEPYEWRVTGRFDRVRVLALDDSRPTWALEVKP